MKLKLVTPSSTRNYDVVWIEINTDSGSLIIQKGHAPTMLVLAPGKETIFRLKDGKQESLVVPHGIICVARTEATMVVQEI